MGSSTGDVQITIGATAATLQGDLNQARQIVEDWSKEVKDSSKHAEEGFKGVAGALKEYSSEQRQQGRVAGFFVKELAEIAPISNSAKTALGGLVGALAGGFGVGMAVDLVLTGVKLLTESWRENTEKMEEARKKSIELNEQFEKAWQEEQRRQEEQRAKRGSEIVKSLADREKEIALARAGLGDYRSRDDEQRRIEHETKIRDLRHEMWRESAQGHSEIAAALEMQLAKEEELYKLVQARHAEERRIRAIKSQFSTPVQGGTEDEGQDLSKNAEAREAAAKQARFQKDLEIKRAIDQAKIEADNKKFIEDFEEGERRKQEAIRNTMSTAQQMGEALGEVAAKIASGQATVADLFKVTTQEIVKSLFASAITQIQMNAAVAGTEAAKSQAGIPVVGPALAVGAMSAMQALILAQLATLPSAEGGWRVPTGVNPVTQLHSGEHVIPERIAKRYEEGAPGGGGLTVNIKTPYVDRAGARLLAEDVNREQRKIARRRRS